MYQKSEINIKAPGLPGIYFLYSKRGKLVYIGRSKNLRMRLKEHILNLEEAYSYTKRKGNCAPYGIEFAKPFEFFRYIIISDSNVLHRTELELIKELKPPYNYMTLFRKNLLRKWKKKHLRD